MTTALRCVMCSHRLARLGASSRCIRGSPQQALVHHEQLQLRHPACLCLLLSCIGHLYSGTRR